MKLTTGFDYVMSAIMNKLSHTQPQTNATAVNTRFSLISFFHSLQPLYGHTGPYPAYMGTCLSLGLTVLTSGYIHQSRL